MHIETSISDSFVRIPIKTPPIPFDGNEEIGITSTMTIDVKSLESELRDEISGEVRFGDGDRGMYASDAGNYRMVPIGVVLPKDAEDVVRTLAVCRRHGAPIVARGGGTGIPGQTMNVAVLNTCIGSSS